MPERSSISASAKPVQVWSSASRWMIIAVICVAVATVIWFHAPIPQSQNYHHFAEQRTIAGITHGLDVLSNVAFLLSGVLGLIYVARAGSAFDAGTRWAFAALFFGLVLTSFGSGYYHLSPNNQSLVFDRLPMIVAMSGCVGAVIADRFGGRGAWSILLLLAIGFWTVWQWNASEHVGHGDLRWYALYQGLVILVGALLLLLFSSRNGLTQVFVIAVAGNVLAKVFELLDRPIFVALNGMVSGHTLKHLSAGLAFLPLAFAIRRIGKHRMGHVTAVAEPIMAGSTCLRK